MQSSRAEQEAFGHCLIDKAKKTGYYIDPSKFDSFGERKRKPSGECVVYIDEANNRVIKVKDPYAKAPLKGHAAEDAIYEHIVHNLLFPDTEYRLLGISESSIGDVRFILEQEYLKDGYEPTTQKQIDEYLSKELRLIKEGKYWYGNPLPMWMPRATMCFPTIAANYILSILSSNSKSRQKMLSTF